MIDIHSHLLPAVDDGSQSVETSVEVLHRFAADGVTLLVCTPHLRASEATTAPVAQYREVLDALRTAAPAVPRLAAGWEIMLDVPRADLTAPELALDGSTAVLVEFPHSGVPPCATEELARLRASGVVPVLAHPERYWGCTLDDVAEWRSAGTVMQMDVIALLAGGRMGQFAVQLLESGLIDCFASDNHGDGQSLAVARDWLARLGAIGHVRLMTEINPRRLLRNDPPLPVPPLAPPASGLGRTVLRHLRDLVRLSRPGARAARPVGPTSE